MKSLRRIIAALRGYLFTLRCRYLRKGIHIGEGLKLFCTLEIQGPGTVSIGNNCVISGAPGDRRRFVTIDALSPVADIVIGDNAMLVAGRITSKFAVHIGDDFFLEESGITDTDFHAITADRGPPSESVEKCRVSIGNRVSVGARSMICKGVLVGDDVIVYPGTIVSKTVPPRSIVYGNPMRLLKKDQV